MAGAAAAPEAPAVTEPGDEPHKVKKKKVKSENGAALPASAPAAAPAAAAPVVNGGLEEVGKTQEETSGSG